MKYVPRNTSDKYPSTNMPEVDAFQFLANVDPGDMSLATISSHMEEYAQWLGPKDHHLFIPERPPFKSGELEILVGVPGFFLEIRRGDYIVKVGDMIYPCRKELFEHFYKAKEPAGVQV